MEKFTQKWAIISLLEDVDEGSVFYYTDFPLHVTLAGVFAIDKDEGQLVKELADLLSSQQPVVIEADKKDMFGPEKNIAVMRIKKSRELMKLYGLIYNWLNESGVVYNTPEYQGDGYLPHSTFQKSASLAAGEQRILQSVSLIDLFPNQDGYSRKISKTIMLQ